LAVHLGLDHASPGVAWGETDGPWLCPSMRHSRGVPSMDHAHRSASTLINEMYTPPMIARTAPLVVLDVNVGV